MLCCKSAQMGCRAKKFLHDKADPVFVTGKLPPSATAAVHLNWYRKMV